MYLETLLKMLKPRIAYIAFLECEIRGKWESEEDERIDMNGEEFPAGRHSYRSLENRCELWIVQPNLNRRAFSFKRHSEIEIIGATVKFYQGDIIQELAVDEQKQQGK